MPGRLLGYARISSIKRMIDRVKLSQLAGQNLNEMFLERADSKDGDRRQLKRLIAFASDGDTVVCQAMDRMGLNTEHLTSVIEELTNKGVTVNFLDENLAFPPGDSARIRMLLHAMLAAARFEQSLLAERSRESSFRVLGRPRYRPENLGKVTRLTHERIAELRRDARAGMSKAALSKIYGIDRKTVAKHLDDAIGGILPNYKGRAPALAESQIVALRHDAEAGLSKVQLAEKYGVSRQTIFRYLQAPAAKA